MKVHAKYIYTLVLEAQFEFPVSSILLMKDANNICQDKYKEK